MKDKAKQENKQQETILKELFQQLRQEDERRAPSFAGSWMAAQARSTRRDQDQRAWRFAAVAASVLIVAGIVGWFVFGKRPADVARQDRQTRTDPSVSPTPLPGSLVPLPPAVMPGHELAKQPHRTPQRVHRQTAESGVEEVEVVTQFFPLREGEDLAALESMRLVRVELPGTALGEVGLPVAIEAANTPVKADIVLGDDGLARAIRFVR